MDKIIHDISVDMQRPMAACPVRVKQYDSLSRQLRLSAYNGGEPWPIAEVIQECNKCVVYCKADGTGGIYDRMPDSDVPNSAFSIYAEGTGNDNVLLIDCAPQMLTCPGLVCCELRLSDTQGAQLGTFSFYLSVEASAETGIKSEDYFRYSTLDSVWAAIGQMAELPTDDKSSLVGAIKELAGQLYLPPEILKKFAERFAEAESDEASACVPYFDPMVGDAGAIGLLLIDRTRDEEDSPGVLSVPSAGQVGNMIKILQSDAAQETAPLGEELASAEGWTSEGWTGDFESGFTHVSGNTTPLTFVMPEATGTKLYRIGCQLSTALNPFDLLVAVGNSDVFDTYGYEGSSLYLDLGIRSVEDGVLSFIPASSFTGTISNVTVKEIVGGCEALREIVDSNGNKTCELRYTKAELNSIFIGKNSGSMNTSGRGCVGLGANALSNNTSGFWNIGIGLNSLRNVAAGTRNVGIGYGALMRNICGHRNIGIGSFSLVNCINGDWNIAIGADSQDHLTSGEYNTAVGFSTLYNNQTGNNNVAIGARALQAGENPADSVAVGVETAFNASGVRNVAIGHRAMLNVSSGEKNVAIGCLAGAGAKDSTASTNVMIGMQAGFKITSASDNVMVGNAAGFALTSGSGNVLIGASAGDNITTGQRHIVIGSGVDAALDIAEHYTLNIGNLIKGNLRSGEAFMKVCGGLDLSDIPTADPGVAGRVWNDGGSLKISTGEAGA